MNVPVSTEEIFEKLSHGNFICENSPDTSEQKLYSVCERYFDELERYFGYIGFDLMSGNGFFYFSKKLQKIQIEEKLNRILSFLDLVYVMTRYSENFSPGWRGNPMELAIAAKDNSVLKNELERLKYPNSTLKQRCEKVFEDFVKAGFMALENEFESRYIVLNSYHYLETFLRSIEVDNNELS